MNNGVQDKELKSNNQFNLLHELSAISNEHQRLKEYVYYSYEGWLQRQIPLVMGVVLCMQYNVEDMCRNGYSTLFSQN